MSFKKLLLIKTTYLIILDNNTSKCLVKFVI